jgi:hypothetical protein
MIAWMNGEMVDVTEAYLNAPWSGNKKYFRCGFCGHKFKLGDKFRAVFTNHVKGASGNPLVCEDCNDTDECLIGRWKHKHEQINNGEFWWFLRGTYYAR